MGLVDELRKLKKSNQVTYMNFLKGLNKSKPSVHVFYEGKTDNGFYGSLIRREIPNEVTVKTYVCGNKNEVYKTREKLLVRTYPNDSLIFLVDKDLDDLIPIQRVDSQDIFVTEYYSIENYLVNDNVFSQTCSELYKLDAGTEQLELITAEFKKACKTYSEAVLVVMAWVLCCRRLQLKPKLNNIKMSDLFSINESLEVLNIKSNSEMISYLHDKAKVDATIFEQYISDVVDELKAVEPLNFIRGKYHLWFFVEFLSMAKLTLEKANQTNIKMHFNLNHSTALDFLGPRLRNPKKLSEFCQNNCAQFVTA